MNSRNNLLVKRLSFALTLMIWSFSIIASSYVDDEGYYINNRYSKAAKIYDRSLPTDTESDWSTSFSFYIGQFSAIESSNTSNSVDGLNRVNGLDVKMGPTFYLGSSFFTSSRLGVSAGMIKLDNLSAGQADNYKVNMLLDLGLYQRLSYVLHSSGSFKFIPFIEAGIARGVHNTEYSSLTSDKGINHTGTANFNKFIGSAGMKFMFDNFAPYIQYDYGQYYFDGVYTYSDNANPVYEAKKNYQYQSVSIGINFVF